MRNKKLKKKNNGKPTRERTGPTPLANVSFDPDKRKKVFNI